MGWGHGNAVPLRRTVFHPITKGVGKARTSTALSDLVDIASIMFRIAEGIKLIAAKAKP